MTDLIPILVPLKGSFGSNASLSDCEYDHDKQGKPIVTFSIAIANIGRGPLHVILGQQLPPDENGKVLAPAKQRIFSNDGKYRDEDVGFFERHDEPDMVHWHYEGLASMDLVDKDGKVISTSDKEGYCLADSFRYNPNLANSPATGLFMPLACVQKTEVGLSIGWADCYNFRADNQYIKIGMVPNGKYWIRLTVKPTKLTCEITEPKSVEVNIDHDNQKVWTEENEKEMLNIYNW
jgi:hypothetical protein